MSDYIEAGFDSFFQRRTEQPIKTSTSLDVEGMTESLPTNLLTTGKIVGKKLIIDLDEGTITSGDGTSDRVFIGGGIFKVARRGFNGETAATAQLLFNSEV